MKNQCDGCVANMPIKDGIHQHGGKNHMCCCSAKYADSKDSANKTERGERVMK